jgi:hypothetical protein
MQTGLRMACGTGPNSRKKPFRDVLKMRATELAAPATDLLHHQEEQVMATITISTLLFISSTHNDTPGITLNSGDSLNLLATAGIIDDAMGNSPAILAGGANSLTLNGNVKSLARPGGSST